MADDIWSKTRERREKEGESMATQGSATDDVRPHMKTMPQNEFSGYDKISAAERKANADKRAAELKKKLKDH